MVFHALTFARSRGRCWKPKPEDLANVNALTKKKHVRSFDRYYCIKTENISRYFLHYFVWPVHRCLANAISTDYARSRAGQYTSRNGSKYMAPVRTYWKFRSRALTAHELLYGFFAGYCMAVNNGRHYFLCNNQYSIVLFSQLCSLYPEIKLSGSSANDCSNLERLVIKIVFRHDC